MSILLYFTKYFKNIYHKKKGLSGSNNSRYLRYENTYNIATLIDFKYPNPVLPM